MPKYLNLLLGEFGRSVADMKRHPLDTGAMVFMFSLMFFMMLFFSKNVTHGVSVDEGARAELEANSARMLVGYIVWLVSSGALNLMSSQLAIEAQAGTLQQIFLTPMGFTRLLLARAAVGFVFSLLVTGIIAFVILSVSGILLTVDYAAIGLTLVFIWIGVSGIGLVFAGLTLVFKRINQFISLFVWGSILITFTPIEQAPAWLMFFIRTFPLTQGMKIFRATAVGEETILTLVTSWEMLFLALGSVVYFAIGLWCYQRLEHLARKKGVLGQY